MYQPWRSCILTPDFWVPQLLHSRISRDHNEQSDQGQDMNLRYTRADMKINPAIKEHPDLPL
jgi:hypothetical protein